MSTLMTPMAVSAKIKAIKDRIVEPYAAKMHELKAMRKNKRIDKFSYIQATEKLFADFEEQFDKEVAPLIRLLCVLFIAIFFSLQVIGANPVMRTSRSRTLRTQTISRTGRKVEIC